MHSIQLFRAHSRLLQLHVGEENWAGGLFSPQCGKIISKEAFESNSSIY